MNWTTEVPKVPGSYFWKASSSAKISWGMFVHHGIDNVLVSDDIDGNHYTLFMLGGLWYGPLPFEPPKEKTKMYNPDIGNALGLSEHSGVEGSLPPPPPRCGLTFSEAWRAAKDGEFIDRPGLEFSMKVVHNERFVQICLTDEHFCATDWQVVKRQPAVRYAVGHGVNIIDSPAYLTKDEARIFLNLWRNTPVNIGKEAFIVKIEWPDLLELAILEGT